MVSTSLIAWIQLYGLENVCYLPIQKSNAIMIVDDTGCIANEYNEMVMIRYLEDEERVFCLSYETKKDTGVLGGIGVSSAKDLVTKREETSIYCFNCCMSMFILQCGDQYGFAAPQNELISSPYPKLNTNGRNDIKFNARKSMVFLEDPMGSEKPYVADQYLKSLPVSSTILAITTGFCGLPIEIIKYPCLTLAIGQILAISLSIAVNIVSYVPNLSYKPSHRHKNSELCVKITLSRFYAQWGAPSVGYHSENYRHEKCPNHNAKIKRATTGFWGLTTTIVSVTAIATITKRLTFLSDEAECIVRPDNVLSTLDRQRYFNSQASMGIEDFVDYSSNTSRQISNDIFHHGVPLRKSCGFIVRPLYSSSYISDTGVTWSHDVYTKNVSVDIQRNPNVQLLKTEKLQVCICFPRIYQELATTEGVSPSYHVPSNYHVQFVDLVLLPSLGIVFDNSVVPVPLDYEPAAHSGMGKSM
ncbi:hypothetical protein G6F57_011920 [Rhizopus arrhizus]|nr:hypothetical protein G6F21_011381 [Rhizopus arrhizus]KAG0786295.1 hypothetical protein G6F22_007676 [Rhizopus arrhizus]KAG0848506.1 hypothetical protein G6F17_011590 [Rhizopus arrhizus]KAG0863558.1 hypothetical protein G6F16_011707 [Rhizopus arrhizus]KAG0870275.1 hypothetical protein G6F15_011696 [Rhizopus arrhizus]